MNALPLRTRQQGLSLLESLLAILIFSVGILAIVALQASSVKATTEAKLRTDASFMASQIIARMWTDASNLASYQYNTGGAYSGGGNAFGGYGVCPFAGGGVGANAARDAWVGDTQASVPGNVAGLTQILVNTAPGASNNMVTVNICWRSGNDIHVFSTVTQINI